MCIALLFQDSEPFSTLPALKPHLIIAHFDRLAHRVHHPLHRFKRWRGFVEHFRRLFQCFCVPGKKGIWRAVRTRLRLKEYVLGFSEMVGIVTDSLLSLLFLLFPCCLLSQVLLLLLIPFLSLLADAAPAVERASQLNVANGRVPNKNGQLTHLSGSMTCFFLPLPRGVFGPTISPRSPLLTTGELLLLRRSSLITLVAGSHSPLGPVACNYDLPCELVPVRCYLRVRARCACAVCMRCAWMCEWVCPRSFLMPECAASRTQSIELRAGDQA